MRSKVPVEGNEEVEAGLDVVQQQDEVVLLRVHCHINLLLCSYATACGAIFNQS